MMGWGGAANVYIVSHEKDFTMRFHCQDNPSLICGTYGCLLSLQSICFFFCFFISFCGSRKFSCATRLTFFSFADSLFSFN